MNYHEIARKSLRMLGDALFTYRERIVAQVIIQESLGAGYRAVPMYQREIMILTGLDERGVSVAIEGLVENGVLQIIGPRGRARTFRWLPNGEILPPELRIDEAAAAAVRLRIAARRIHGEDVEEDGQIPLLTTPEENLANDFAAASVVLDDGANGPIAAPASGEERWSDPEWVREESNRRFLEARSSGGAFYTGSTQNDAASDEPSGEATHPGFSDAFPSSATYQKGKSPDTQPLETGPRLAKKESQTAPNTGFDLPKRKVESLAPLATVETNAPAYVGVRLPAVQPVNSTAHRAAVQGTTANSRAVARKGFDDLLEEIRDFVEPGEWGGTAHFARTWRVALDAHPWSRKAAMRALGVMKDRRRAGKQPKKTWCRWLWNTFTGIQEDLRRENESKDQL